MSAAQGSYLRAATVNLSVLGDVAGESVHNPLILLHRDNIHVGVEQNCGKGLL